jgi:hypothetical protein
MAEVAAPEVDVGKPKAGLPERPRRSAARGSQPYLRVSLYERISSFLMASMVALGAILFSAVMFWLTHREPPDIELVPMEIVNLEPEVDFGGSLDGVVGGTADVDTGSDGGGGGGDSSASDVPPVETTLATVTSTAGSSAQQATAAYLDAQTPSGASGTGAGSGTGTGTGGGRPPLGFGKGKGGGVPRELRWYVGFAGDNALDEYAKQLDYFDIEIGVLDPGGKVTYLSGLSKPSSTKRVSNDPGAEKRLNFTWQGGERKGADIKLFEKAGVSVGNGKLYHFYPQKLEDHLATIEFKFANRKAKEIRRTYFQVEKAGGGYQFKVTRQTYLQ